MVSRALGCSRLPGTTLFRSTITNSGGATLALTNSGGTLAGGVTIAAGATLDATQDMTGVQDYAYVTGGLRLNRSANLTAANASTYGQLYFRGPGAETLAGTS